MSCSGDGDGEPRKSNSRKKRTYEDNLEGAVGGRGDLSQYQGMTEDERRIIYQARFLLQSYVMDSAERDHMPPENASILRAAVQEEEAEENRLSQEDEDQLRDVALAFRTIGDEVHEKIEKDRKIKNLINSVAVGSPEEIFKKVCKQVLEDGQLNWGRIVVLFHFAYRLIVKAFKEMDGKTWIKKILKMCVNFFAEYFVWWVVQRGGWKMIMEYWGTSRTTFFTFVAVSVATGLYYYFR